MSRISPLSLLVMTALAGSALAIHPYQLLRQKRPEIIDTTTALKSEGGAIAVSYTSSEEAIPLNKIHTWVLNVTGKDGNPIDGAEIVVSSDMPEHLHGTTTKPRTKPGTKPGQYLVEGMNFHMPGWWEVTMDITGGGTRDLVRFQLVLGEGDCPMCKDPSGEAVGAGSKGKAR